MNEEIKEEKPNRKRVEKPVLCFHVDKPNVKFYRKESEISKSGGKLEKA